MFDVKKFNAAIALKGENQQEAARVMGINPATLYRKIRGESDFYRTEIEAFCNHYNVSPSEIFFAEFSA